jgi:DNA polymerase-4
LSEKVSKRLRDGGLKGKTITLKIRVESFSTYTRDTTLTSATNFVDTMYKAINKLFNNFDLKGRKVRLVGVKVSNLIESDAKDSIFDGKPEQKRENIHKAVDKIKEKFGNSAIYRAARMHHDH